MSAVHGQTYSLNSESDIQVVFVVTVHLPLPGTRCNVTFARKQDIIYALLLFDLVISYTISLHVYVCNDLTSGCVK